MFGLRLGSWSVIKGYGLDPDASSYLNTIISLGASPTTIQKKAVSAFIVAEKAAGRWTSLSRFYFPVWGIAAANAIDMKTLQSGTFNGGVTHASGYIQGNGTTGYLRDSLDLVEMGHTTTTGSYGALITQTANAAFLGIRDGVSDSIFDAGATSINASLAGTGALNGSFATAEQTGVFIASRVGTTVFLRRRRTAGVTSVDSRTAAASGNPLSGTNAELCYLGRWNKNINTLQAPSNARIGCLFVGLGMDTTNADAFTLNIKTLWETVTGLTIA